MKKKIRTECAARFWAPGSFVAEEWLVPITGPDPLAVKFPDNAYAFDVMEREVVVVEGRDFTRPWQVRGPRYYHPDSRVLTLDEVRARPEFAKPRSCLVSNMEGNGWTHIVMSRWGNWPQPFDPKTSVVLEKPR